MRHQKKTLKLGRTAEHRKALLANQVCSLIVHRRIKTTLAKAKAVRPLAERMVTLGKNGSLHARRNALSILRQKDAVKKLFDDIAQKSTNRNGGYTRIVKAEGKRSKTGRTETRRRTSRERREAECANAGRAETEKTPMVRQKNRRRREMIGFAVAGSLCSPRRSSANAGRGVPAGLEFHGGRTPWLQTDQSPVYFSMGNFEPRHAGG